MPGLASLSSAQGCALTPRQQASLSLACLGRRHWSRTVSLLRLQPFATSFGHPGFTPPHPHKVAADAAKDLNSSSIPKSQNLTILQSQNPKIPQSQPRCLLEHQQQPRAGAGLQELVRGQHAAAYAHVVDAAVPGVRPARQGVVRAAADEEAVVE